MSDNRSTLLGWVIPGLAAIIVAAALLIWQWPNIRGPGASTADTEPAQASVSGQSIQLGAPRPFAAGQPGGVINSADHVRVTVLRRGDRLVAELRVDAGWHINANPASLDFLIPTRLTVISGGTPVPVTTDYPRGHNIDLGLAQPIAVYSDEVRITAMLPDGVPAAPLQAALRVQACSNDGRCLMPSTLEVPVLDSGA